MSAPVWNGPLDKVTIVANAIAGTGSTSFSAPNNALGVLFWIPALTATTTLELQSLRPKDGDQDSDTWQAVTTTLTGTTVITKSTVDGFIAGAYGMDAGVIGAGVFRFVVRIATNVAATTINIAWRVDKDR